MKRKWDWFFRMDAMLTLMVAVGVVAAYLIPFFSGGNGNEYEMLFLILILFGVDITGVIALATAAVVLLVSWWTRSTAGTITAILFQLIYGAVFCYVGIRVEFMTPASIGAIPALLLALAGIAVYFTTPKEERHWSKRKKDPMA